MYSPITQKHHCYSPTDPPPHSRSASLQILGCLFLQSPGCSTLRGLEGSFSMQISSFRVPRNVQSRDRPGDSSQSACCQKRVSHKAQTKLGIQGRQERCVRGLESAFRCPIILI